MQPPDHPLQLSPPPPPPPQQEQDWSDSADNNSQEDGYYTTAKGPSLSYERKIRLHKYAENRARSCLGLLSDSSSVLWKLQDHKGDVALFKPSSEWSEFVSAKAVIRANASFPNVLKTIYDLKTSDKFKMFLRKVLGDGYLDADVLEDLNGTGVYPSANPPKDAREMYKQAAIKWWAIKSGSLASKSSDFYVLEYIGIETSGGDITSCYLFQESLAEVGGMPQIQGNNLERSQFDALICKFERLPVKDYAQEFVLISIVFQRPPPMVTLFRSNPAVEMVLQFAKGLRDLLEDPPEHQEISVVKTSAWVKDKERQYCIICVRRFSSIFRRRHHCRMCGEVICWKCSSTIRVPSISFTHNDSGKQVLSRHQPSIRVCTKCVVSQHRSKSGRELNNQEDFKEWLHRTKASSGDDSQMLIPVFSPSHSQDLTGALDEEAGSDAHSYARSHSEGNLPRRYQRLSMDEEEMKENDHEQPSEYRSKDNQHGEERDSSLKRYSRTSASKQMSTNSQQQKQRQHSQHSNPRHSSNADIRSSIQRRSRRSHSDVSLQEMSRKGRPSNVASTIGSRTHLPKDYIKYLANQESSRTLYSRDFPLGSITSQDYAIDKRPSSTTEHLLMQNSSCVHAASAWATNKTESLAMTGAFQELLTKLGGEVHFVVVGFSTGFEADVIVDLLRQLAPGVPYIGGTIARGMCDENAWVSVNRHNDEGLVTLWGVNDPHGIYTVVHAEYSQSDAREKTFAAAKTAYARVAADVDPGEKPAFTAVYACPLFVEHAIEGIREAIHCPIVGGCSSDAARQRDGEVSVSWIQISSSSSSDYTKSVRDGRGDWTEMGIAFALCFPSVETYVSWFSGYSPVGVNSEYCMGTVTKASNKTIYEIDCKPAAEVYQEVRHDELALHYWLY